MPARWGSWAHGALTAERHFGQRPCLDGAVQLFVARAALFEIYKVNSASAFIRLFTASPLLPPWEAASNKVKKPVELATWTVQETASTAYIGQMRGGKRHGNGLLLVKVSLEVAVAVPPCGHLCPVG